MLWLLVMCLWLGCADSIVPSSDGDTEATESSADESLTHTVFDSETETETETEAETETETETDDGIFRFGVMSDTHIGDGSVGRNMANALEALRNISADRLDIMLFAGDLTNDTAALNTNTQIKSFRSQYRRALDGTPFVYCLGSTHDLPMVQEGGANNTPALRRLYQDILDGFDYDLSPDTYADSGIRHATVQGYHIFAVDYFPSAEGVATMRDEMEALTAADPDRPIFVIMHNPYPYIDGEGGAYEDEAIEMSLFSAFPQAIVFSGHVHNSAAREDSIKQDAGYTQVHIGGAAYYRVDGYNRFHDNPFLSLGNIYQFSQSLYVEVSADNTVTITRVDGHAGVAFGEPWVISPTRRDIYTDARKEAAKPCLFSDDAEISVTESGTDTATVVFDGATMGDAGPALYYHIEWLQKNAGGQYVTVKTADLGSQQVFYPNDEHIPKGHYQHTFTGVDLTDYAVVVHAVDCWQTSGNVLTCAKGGYVYGDGNLAFGKKVTVTAGASREGHAEYSPAMLTDGLFGYYSNNPVRRRGWDKAEGFIVSEENPIDITIDLGGTYEISKVVIHPIVSYNNVFPDCFVYQVSATDDGDDWVTVKVNEGVVCNGRLSGSAPIEDYDPDNHYDVTFAEPVEARRFRVHITAPSPAENGEDCYMGFGEIELWP